MNFYVTFGQVHTHPKTGDKLKDYWIRVLAISEEDARGHTREFFDNKYFSVYKDWEFDDDKKEYFPMGLYETQITKQFAKVDEVEKDKKKGYEIY